MATQFNELHKLALNVLSNAAGVEQDASHAEDEDDLMDLLSWIEITERSIATLRDAIKKTLET